MLVDLPATAQKALAPAARQLLALWASVHNLGVHWAEQDDSLALISPPRWPRGAAIWI